MTLDDDDLKIVPERDNPTPERRTSTGSVNVGAWAAAAILFAAGGSLYYQNTLLSAEIKAYQSKLDSQASLLAEQQDRGSQMELRVQSLESKLAATGRDLSQSGSSLEKRIEEAGSSLEKRIKASEHEIRKLWDLSNKRNKVDITAHGKQLADIGKRLDGLKQVLEKQQQAVAGQQKDLSKQESDLVAQKKALTDQLVKLEQRNKQLSDQQNAFTKAQNTLSEQYSGHSLQLTSFEKYQQVLIKQDQVLEKSVAQLKTKLKLLEQHSKQLAVLDKKLVQLDTLGQTDIKVLLDDHGERLDAIDASRRQFTSRVMRLTTDVNQLQLDVDKLKPVVQ